MILSRGPELHIGDALLPTVPLAAPPAVAPDAAPPSAPAASGLGDVERQHIAATLRRTRWRIDGPQGAARLLGLNPSTLRSRIKKLGIRRSDLRD